MSSSNWKTYKLGDLGSFFGGVTSIKKEDYRHGTPFLPYKNVYKNSKVNINELELMNVRPLDLERRNAIYGDIFFTASSETPDEVAMSSVLLDNIKNLTFNGFCKRLRLHDFKTLLPEYARYLFRDTNFRQIVYQVATGDVRYNISQESLSGIEISLPDISTQKQIASILTSIDDSIELNIQLNQTLEQITKTLFKEICLPKSNEIPDGWSIQMLQKFIEVKNGYAFKGGDFIDSGVPVIKIKNVKAGRIILDNLSFVSRDVADRAQRFRIKLNDILITMSGNRIDGTPETWVGKVGIFHKDEEYLLNQRVSILRVIDEELMSRYFLCQLFSTEGFQYYFISNATSSGGQANISPDLIYNTEIVVPPKEVMQKFHDLAKDIYNKIFANELEIETLANLRDALLPKLMNGEINV